MRTLSVFVAAAAVTVLAVTADARAQSSQEVAQMRLYIQELEQQVRMLTGENERLLHELRMLQARMGQAGPGQADIATGSTAVPATEPAGEVVGATPAPPADSDGQLGAPPRNLGTLTITEGGEAIASGGGPAPAPPVGDAGPVDLSALAGGIAALSDIPPEPEAGATVAPQMQTSIPAGSRQAYDVAYGYVLTGDHDIAEAQFRAWLETYPGDPQAADARFWLGESQLQQGKHREAANTLLELYRDAPTSRKAPDTLLRLGMALAALGEQSAACSTFGEIAKRHPNAPASLTARAATQADRVGC